MNLDWMLLTMAVALAAVTECRMENCRGLDPEVAHRKFATWYPLICTNVSVPLGTKCFLKCNSSYIASDGANTETDCGKRSSYEAPNFPGAYSLDHCIGTPCSPVESGNQTVDVVPKIIGVHCQKNEVKSGSGCHYSCPGMTTIVGTTYKVCLVNGTYSIPGGAYCKPDPPPIKFECPHNDLTISVDPGKATADAFGQFGKPTGTFDEARLQQVITSSHKNIHKLPVGIHTFKYEIYGAPGQHSKKCSISITVLDWNSPYVVACPEEFEYVVETNETVQVETRPVLFEDKVLSSLTLSDVSRIMGFKQGVGDYQNIKRAYDSRSNVASCISNVKVRDGGSCKIKYSPLNGVAQFFKKLGFTPAGYKTVCDNNTVKICDTSGGINIFACFGGIKCSKDLKGLKIPLISCAVLEPYINRSSCPNGSFSYLYGCLPCERSTFFNFTTRRCHLCPENTTNYQRGSFNCTPCPPSQMTKLKLGPRFCENVCEDGFVFDLASKTCSRCGPHSFVESGGTTCKSCPPHTVTIVDAATKKEDCVFGKLVTTTNGTVYLSSENTSSFTNWRLRIKPSNVSTNGIYQRLVLHLKSNQLSNQTNCSESYVEVTGVYRGFVTTLSKKICGPALKNAFTVKFRPWRDHYVDYIWSSGKSPDITISFGLAPCTRGQYYNLSTFSCTPCPKQTSQNETGAPSCKPCPVGEAAPEEGMPFCKAGCLPGYFRKGVRCSPCPIGTYSEKRESMSCENCGSGLSTAHLCTDNRTKCIGACSSGTYRSSNGNCIPCPVGSFQDEPLHAISICKYCPDGNTTRDKGSTSLGDCFAGCHYEGEFYNISISECQKCPLGTYKYASIVTPLACTPCPTNYTTKRVGAVSKLQCVKMALFDNCTPNPCKFPGRCINTGSGFKCICTDQFSGTLCEKDLHPCKRNLCKNNATCFRRGPGTLFCDCKPGYTGSYCERRYLPCTPRLCMNGGNCTNVGNDYRCTCPPYFTGKSCQTYIQRPCERKHCAVGTCTDGPYPGAVPPFRCTCSTGFTGTYCDKNIDDCASNPCFADGTQQCTDFINSFSCLCKLNYYGRLCNLTVCSAGYYFNQSCIRCPVGAYKSYRGNSLCIKCPYGKTTKQRGSVYQNDCIDVKKLVIVTGSIKIKSLHWHVDLLNKGSSLFDQTVQLVESQVRAVYKDDAKFQDVVVQSFRRGSVISDFIAFFDEQTTNSIGKLEDAVKSGQVGNLSVDPTYLKLEKPKQEEKKESNAVVIAVAVIVVLLVIAFICGIAWWYYRYRYKKNMESSNRPVAFKKSKNSYPLDGSTANIVQ